jgi:hypothetical protein
MQLQRRCQKDSDVTWDKSWGKEALGIRSRFVQHWAALEVA